MIYQKVRPVLKETIQALLLSGNYFAPGFFGITALG